MWTSAMHITLMADTTTAGSTMQGYVAPIMHTLCILASLVCVFFLTTGGFHYMTSSGKPEKLEHAKNVIKNALIGLVIVLAAAVLTAVLSHAYASSGAQMTEKLPGLTTITPKPVSNSLVAVLIKAITGLLNNIVQSIGSPFMQALQYFTKATPLMAANSSVFNLWFTVVGIADALFVVVVALLGFHIMSFTSLGFSEVSFKHLIPRLALTFLLMNTSIFAIDGIIDLSNAMISAVNAGVTTGSVWSALAKITEGSASLSVGALLIMIAFVALSLILLVYYVGRIVTLYIGTTLSPLILLLWLVPGFRDFTESAVKVYLTTIFVLFVHVIILALAASLFIGISLGSPGHNPDTLMGLIIGLATVIALLKTQGVMMQLSYVSVGPRTARQLGGQFINGISSISSTRQLAARAFSGQNSGYTPRTTDNLSSGRSMSQSKASSSAALPNSKLAAAGKPAANHPLPQTGSALSAHKAPKSGLAKEKK